MPRKIASMKKAMPSMAYGRPITWPSSVMSPDQRAPISMEKIIHGSTLSHNGLDYSAESAGSRLS
jgi:hypothetical protein